jgi:signal transduction histidine kinase
VVASGPATLVAAYTAATLLPTRRAATAVAGAVALEALGSLVLAGARDAFPVGVAAVVNAAVTGVGAALVGAWVRTRRSYVDLVQQRAVDAVAAQEARVRAAVTDERSRMARELHDVAAHHLSAMVVQATATARLVEKDPEATREGLLALRAQGRRTLEDLRLLVGVLRDPATVEDGAPVPGLADLGSLVEEARSLGTEVRLEATGGPARLGPLADVAAYRLVQEALSNARQHAAGAAVLVAVTGRPDLVVVTVTNGPAAGTSPPARTTEGVGLVGMRERVQLAGGRLDAGEDGSGGWTVRAELPGSPEHTAEEEDRG